MKTMVKSSIAMALIGILLIAKTYLSHSEMLMGVSQIESPLYILMAASALLSFTLIMDVTGVAHKFLESDSMRRFLYKLYLSGGAIVLTGLVYLVMPLKTNTLSFIPLWLGWYFMILTALTACWMIVFGLKKGRC